MGMSRRRGTAAALAIAVALVVPAAAHAFDAGLEAKNFAKTSERLTYVTLTPEFQLRLAQASTANIAAAAKIVATDPERNFAGNVCANGGNECAGDVRFYDWAKDGMGVMKPVLFTARNGSTLSGHLWASAKGPKKRPLVVITNGSVQAPEHLYWGQAATLAKHGYVVLTYDPQGQGLSDTFGAGPDHLDGVPSQEGTPFYNDTEDALDFALSTPTAALRSAPELHLAAPTTPTSRTAGSRRASTPPTTRSGSWSTASASASPATRWAPPPSPTSVRSTSASTRRSPGTT